MSGRLPLSLAAAGALLLGLAGCGSSGRFVEIGSVSAVRPASGMNRLEVDGRAGSITITPSSGDEVAVSAAVAVRESLLAQYPVADAARDLVIEVDGDVLRVADAHRRELRNDFKLDFTITAPARLAWRLEVGAGRIDATGRDNSIDAETGAGEVRIRGAVASLRAHSGAGSVVADVESIAGGSLHSGAGAVHVTIAGGALKEKLSCSSGAGKVAIDLPSGFSADVSLETGAGRVVVDGATFSTSSHLVGGSVSGRLGAGGPPLVAETGAGEVILRVRS